MLKLYDFVRPKDDPFKSIWQVLKIEDDGRVQIYKVGHTENIQYFEIAPYSKGWERRSELYGEDPVYCYPETLVKLVITEEEIND